MAIEKVIKRHEYGFINVRTTSKEEVTIPAFTRVKDIKESNGRTYFSLVDILLNTKEKELSLQGTISQNIGEINIKNGLHISFNRESKNLKITSAGKNLLTCKAKLIQDLNDPMPNGTYKIYLPDYHHGDSTGCKQYLGNSDFACVWFRISHGKNQNYLHVGEDSAGCISVGPADKDKDKWTDIYHILMSHRMGNKYVGQIQISGNEVFTYYIKADTSSVKYGGRAYGGCIWVMKYTDVNFSFELDITKKKISKIQLSNFENETANKRSCYPAGRKRDVYKVAGFSFRNNIIKINFKPSSSNFHKCNAEFNGKLSGRTVEGTLTWKRYDQAPAINYTIRKYVVLNRR